jgi:cytochrome c-type biogenesis protein CcmE
MNNQQDDNQQQDTFKRDRTRRRVALVVSLLVAMAAFGFLALGDLGDNLVYYWSPTELGEAGNKAMGADVRLGGLVAPDSVVRGDDGLSLEFAVTDGTNTVPVRAKSLPPAMFREGIGVVLEGTLAKDGVFETERMMVKHDNEYKAPDEKQDKNIEEMMKTLQFDVRDT